MSDPQPMSLAQAVDLAIAHHAAGRGDEAANVYRQILDQAPTHAPALNLFGVLTLERGDAAAGERMMAESVRIDPRPAHFHSNHAMALLAIDRPADALDATDRAIAIDGGLVEAHSLRATALHALRRFDEAATAAEAAVRRRSDAPVLLKQLGRCLKAVGRFAEALDVTQRAIQLAPDDAGAHYNAAILRLTLGDLRGGFAEYEWRSKWPDYFKYTPRWNERLPRWTGDDLAGRTLLLHAEQGFGDTLQMVRYAALLRGRGAGRVLLCCQPELTRLLATAAGIDHVFARGEPSPPFDVHLPMMSLPHAFGTTLQTIPAALPYLHSDAAQAAVWKQRFNAEAGAPRLRVGLCWAGRAGHSNDRERSLALTALAPLAAVPGVRFYSLQKGPAAADAARPPARMELSDYSTELNDFADTAALMAALDLTITVDSAPAHLAGTLGRPAWVMLPWMADWRWMLARADSPWYPASVRLFRQAGPSQWAGVVARVAEALAHFGSTQPSETAPTVSRLPV